MMENVYHFHVGLRFIMFYLCFIIHLPFPPFTTGSRDDEDTVEQARRSQDDTRRRQEQQH